MRAFILIFLSSMAFSALAATSTKCPGEQGYRYTNDRDRNPTPGGFVSNGAHVSEDSFVAPTAAVCGSAMVTGSRVLGVSVVKGNAFVENSVLMGNAIIGGDAHVDKSHLRGFHHYTTGEIVNVKTFKKKSTSQIRSEEAQKAAKRIARRAAIRDKLWGLKYQKVNFMQYCYKNYNECTYRLYDLPDYVGELITNARKAGLTVRQHQLKVNPGNRIYEPGFIEFEKYQAEFVALEKELASLR